MTNPKPEGYARGYQAGYQVGRNWRRRQPTAAPKPGGWIRIHARHLQEARASGDPEAVEKAMAAAVAVFKARLSMEELMVAADALAEWMPDARRMVAEEIRGMIAAKTAPPEPEVKP